MWYSLLLYKSVHIFIDVPYHAVHHSVPSVRLSIELKGWWEMFGEILKDPEAYVDNLKMLRAKSLQMIIYFYMR